MLTKINGEYFMKYRDLRGMESERKISLVSYSDKTNYKFSCYCHLREAERFFNFDGVLEIKDLANGEVSNNAMELFSKNIAETVEEPNGNFQQSFEQWMRDQGMSAASMQNYTRALKIILDDAKKPIEAFAKEAEAQLARYRAGGDKTELGEIGHGSGKAVVRKLSLYMQSLNGTSVPPVQPISQPTQQHVEEPKKKSLFGKIFGGIFGSKAETVPVSAPAPTPTYQPRPSGNQDMDSFRNWMLNSGRAPNSVNSYMSSLNKVLQDAQMPFNQFASQISSRWMDYYRGGSKESIGNQNNGACRAVVKQLMEYMRSGGRVSSVSTNAPLPKPVQSPIVQNIPETKNEATADVVQVQEAPAPAVPEQTATPELDPLYENQVFVSYSRADKAIVYPLVEKLQKDIGAKFWVDLHGIESGDQFVDVIISAIDNSKFILFMHSANSLKSDWTKKEVMYAADEGKKVIPLLVDDTKLGGWFKFQFGGTDFIDPKNEAQYQKLVNNLKGWMGK